MTIARRTGAPGKADTLIRRIVHSRGACEYCGAPGTDAAHIVKRRFSATRCLEENLWFLCRSCHIETEQWPLRFLHLVDETIGRARYDELVQTANAGLSVPSKVFWPAEVLRLTARCEELGIDTRSRIPA
jgi:hypothetical protein